MYKKSIVTFSFGKTFHNTGWKVGYAIAPPEIMKEFKRLHQFIVFSVNTPVQYALAEYMRDENTYNSLNANYEVKRDLFLAGLSKSKFSFVPTLGTYFQLLDYSSISTKKDVDFCARIGTRLWCSCYPIITIL